MQVQSRAEVTLLLILTGFPVVNRTVSSVVLVFGFLARREFLSSGQSTLQPWAEDLSKALHQISYAYCDVQNASMTPFFLFDSRNNTDSSAARGVWGYTYGLCAIHHLRTDHKVHCSLLGQNLSALVYVANHG